MNPEDLNSVRETFKDLDPKAAGYRVLIQPIDATQGMESVETDKFETLNRIAREKGTEVATKSDNQQERESKGSDVGVVIDVGPFAYKAEHMMGDWCKAGDVVLFKRYEGHQFEWPPGSGVRYHLVNDEDIFGIAGQSAHVELAEVKS